MKLEKYSEDEVQLITTQRILKDYPNRPNNRKIGEGCTKRDIVDNVWFNRVELIEVGDTKEGHIHNFSHITLIASGAVDVIQIDEYGTETILGKAGTDEKIVVPQNIAHKLVATAPNTIVYCIEYVPAVDINN